LNTASAAAGGIMAVALNLILPRDEKDQVVRLEE